VTKEEWNKVEWLHIEAESFSRHVRSRYRAVCGLMIKFSLKWWDIYWLSPLLPPPKGKRDPTCIRVLSELHDRGGLIVALIFA